jgi:hypothetical protein
MKKKKKKLIAKHNQKNIIKRKNKKKLFVLILFLQVTIESLPAYEGREHKDILNQPIFWCHPR